MARRWGYDRIAYTLSERIRVGIYPAETRLPSLRDLATDFGVTTGTVSRAIARLEEQDLIESVPRSGVFVRHRPAREDEMLRREPSSRLIGFIAFDTLVSPYWSEVVSVMEARLHDLGYHLVLGNSNREPERAVEYVRSFAARGVDGIVFVPFDAVNEQQYRIRNSMVLNELRASGVPFVLYDRVSIDQGEVPASAGIDNFYYASRLMDHLLASGYSRPLCLSVRYSSSIGQREEAFLTSLARLRGVDAELEVVRLNTHRVTEQDLQSISDAVHHHACDSLFLINSSVLNGYLRAVEAGLIGGEKASLPFVAFEDFPVRGAEHALARCMQRIEPLAQSVAELCVDRVSRRETAIGQAQVDIRIPCEIVLGIEGDVRD